MNDTDYKNYMAQQTLANCGLNQDSIAAIQATKVVTHNGSQHVIHNAQGHMFEKMDVGGGNAVSNLPDSRVLVEQIQIQQQQFSRFKQHADSRILQLESQMSQVMEKLKTAVEVINTLKSNSEASANRARLSEATGRRDPVTEAIDRNGVAPADVSIEKMFYFGNT
ncbi:MAG: hypothetical protein AB7V77_03430 [Candidatus Woesearchaeota archaeon]